MPLELQRISPWRKPVHFQLNELDELHWILPELQFDEYYHDFTRALLPQESPENLEETLEKESQLYKRHHLLSSIAACSGGETQEIMTFERKIAASIWNCWRRKKRGEKKNCDVYCLLKANGRWLTQAPWPSPSNVFCLIYSVSFICVWNKLMDSIASFYSIWSRAISPLFLSTTIRFQFNSVGIEELQNCSWKWWSWRQCSH